METLITPTETETLGKLINGLGIFASQLLAHTRADFYQKSRNNLRKYKRDNETMLRTLDEVAGSLNDEKPLQLIEEICEYSQRDAIGCLHLARRCLLACAFLGHCVAKGAQSSKPAVSAYRRETLLH